MTAVVCLNRPPFSPKRERFLSELQREVLQNLLHRLALSGLFNFLLRSGGKRQPFCVGFLLQPFPLLALLLRCCLS
jgi:hypothetical protein